MPVVTEGCAAPAFRKCKGTLPVFSSQGTLNEKIVLCGVRYDFRRCIQEANGRGPKIRVSLVNGHQRAEIPWRL